MPSLVSPSSSAVSLNNATSLSLSSTTQMPDSVQKMEFLLGPGIHPRAWSPKSLLRQNSSSKTSVRPLTWGEGDQHGPQTVISASPRSWSQTQTQAPGQACGTPICSKSRSPGSSIHPRVRGSVLGRVTEAGAWKPRHHALLLQALTPTSFRRKRALITVTLWKITPKKDVGRLLLCRLDRRGLNWLQVTHPRADATKGSEGGAQESPQVLSFGVQF